MMDKLKKNERGFSLIIVIFAILFLGVMGLAMNLILSTFTDSSILEMRGAQAFYVAEGGKEYILKSQFANDTNYADNVSPTGAPFGGSPITLGPGQFWVQYYNLTTDDGRIVITGRVGSSVRVVSQNFKSTYSNGVSSGGNTTMTQSQSGGGLLNGDLSCGATCSIDPGYTVGGTITSGTGIAPPASSFQALVARTTSTVGSLNINGDYGTAAAPIYVHVTGNVSIGDNAGTIYGMIVSDGNITVGVKQNATRNVYGTLAAAGTVAVDLKQSTVTLFQAQNVGGIIPPVILGVGGVIIDGKQTQSARFQGAIYSGASIGISLKQQDHVYIDGVLWAQNAITVDSMQSSYIGIDPNAGRPYYGGNLLTLTNWQEQ